jgi:hypothetical protein
MARPEEGISILMMLGATIGSLAFIWLAPSFSPESHIAWAIPGRISLPASLRYAETNASSMAWSYVGLLAAACAEGVLRVPLLAALINTPTQAIGLGVTIAVLFTILGALVVPRLQARAFASLD